MLLRSNTRYEIQIYTGWIHLEEDVGEAKYYEANWKVAQSARETWLAPNLKLVKQTNRCKKNFADKQMVAATSAVVSAARETNRQQNWQNSHHI